MKLEIEKKNERQFLKKITSLFYFPQSSFPHAQSPTTQGYQHRHSPRRHFDSHFINTTPSTTLVNWDNSM